MLVRAFGLTIDTAFDLPGAVPTGCSQPDVVIVEGAIPPQHVAQSSGPYALIGSRLLFAAEGVARYLIGDRRIVVDPAGLRDDEHIAALLIATALPALLWMRGVYVLHAAAFVLPGAERAIAVTAPSGGGKSTLLAEALRRGARMVADDVLGLDEMMNFEPKPDCPELVEGLPYSPTSQREGQPFDKLRVSGNGGSVLSGSGLYGGHFLPDGSVTRHFVPVGAEQREDSAAVGSLVVLDRISDTPTGIVRLTGTDALVALLAARHRPRVPALIADPGAHLVQSVLLAQRLAIYRLTVGRAEPAEMFDLVLQGMA